MRYVILLVLLVGCGGSDRRPSTTAERKTCYDKHDNAAAERVERECFKRGHAWDDCPTREEILDTLEANYRSCS